MIQWTSDTAAAYHVFTFMIYIRYIILLDIWRIVRWVGTHDEIASGGYIYDTITVQGTSRAIDRFIARNVVTQFLL